jgi:FlaA1/EpsC-like NDP-sugar epimerase
MTVTVDENDSFAARLRVLVDLFTSLLNRTSPLRVAGLFVFHAAVFTACYGMAWLLRFEFAIPRELVIWPTCIVVVAVQVTTGIFFRFYRDWWRYVAIADVIRLVAGLSTGTAVLFAARYCCALAGLPNRYVYAPRGVLLVDWSLALLTLFGTRVAIRVGRDRFGGRSVTANTTRVLIIGAGDAGETLAREIQHRPQLRLKVVGFIDDHRAKWNSHIGGIRVWGPIRDIAALAAAQRADEALVAIPSATGKQMREIVRHLSEAGLKFKTIPGIDHLVGDRNAWTRIREVNVEDLLRRKRIDLPGDPVRRLLRGRRVLVTGAGGTIGAELTSQVLRLEPEKLILVERSEYALYEIGKRLHREVSRSATRISSNLIDICDEEIINSVLANERPHIILHAAAHKHVPLGEENPAEYLRNNCLATRTVAELSISHGVERFVFISTDKAINPSSVMGASKRAAEIALLDLCRESPKMKTTVVRFGNVIGSSGSVVPLFLEQIASGGPITVTHPDVARYFIRVSEAVSLVLQAATLGSAGHISMLDMGEPVKIADLARDLIALANETEDEIPIVFTGLRAGEKLFEETRLEGELTRPTIHPQIVITEAPQPDARLVACWLAEARHVFSAAEAIRLLAALVPEFTAGGDAQTGPLAQLPEFFALAAVAERV